MSTEGPVELRLVHHDEGISAAAPNPAVARQRAMLMMVPAVGMLVPLMAAMMMASPALVAVTSFLYMASLFGFAATGNYSGFHHVRVGAHALHVTQLRVRTRGRPIDIETIRNGEDSAWLMGAPDEGNTYLYSEITDLGFTDYSLWFDVAGERQEIVLGSLSRADIERLAETIRPVWQRAREALQGSAEQADVARRALGQLESPREQGR